MITQLKKALSKVPVTLALCSVYAQTALAQFGGPDPDLGLPGSADEGSLRAMVERIINTVLNFLALVAVIVIIIAGIRLIVSNGEDEAKDKAKKTIFYALGGLAIVLFSKVIVGLITKYVYGEVTN